MADDKYSRNRQKVFDLLKTEGYNDIGDSADELFKDKYNSELAYKLLTEAGYTGLAKDYNEFASKLYAPESPAQESAATSAAPRRITGMFGPETSSFADAPISVQKNEAQRVAQESAAAKAREEVERQEADKAEEEAYRKGYADLADTYEKAREANAPIIEEYERRKAELYQQGSDRDYAFIQSETKWLQDNKAAYDAARQRIAAAKAPMDEYQGLYNLEHKQERLAGLDQKIQENKQARKAVRDRSTPGSPDYDAVSAWMEHSDEDDYTRANEILRMAKQTYRQSSKYEGYEGNWMQDIWNGAKQFVKDGVNNIDRGSFTFGLSEGDALSRAREIGDKNNEIISAKLKDMGVDDRTVSGLIDGLNTKVGKLNTLVQELEAAKGEFDAMEATYKDMVARGESPDEINSLGKELNRLAEDLNKRIEKEYNPLVAEVEQGRSRYESIMSAVDSAVDEGLKPGEKAVLDAFEEFVKAQEAREGDVSVAGAAGAGFEQTLEFMLDFVLTKGLGTAGEKAATKLLTKRMLKKLGKDALDAPLKLGFGARFATDIAVSAARTALMFPRSIGAYGEQLTQLSNELGIKDEFGRYNFKRSQGNALLNTALTQYIEYWSEGFGEYFGAAEKALFKSTTLAAPTTLIGRTLAQYRGSIGKYLDYSKFDGQFNETLEEVVGSGLNALAGWLSGDRVGDKDALRDFASGEQLAILSLSFLPMSVIGAATNIRAYHKMKQRYDAGVAALDPFVKSGAISQQELDGLVSGMKDMTPIQAEEKLVEIIDKARHANHGHLPGNFAQNVLGYIEGSFAMNLDNETWVDQQDKMRVVNEYAQNYSAPDTKRAYDNAQRVRNAEEAAIAAGVDEATLELDAYAITRHADEIAESDPDKAEAMRRYAEALGAWQGMRDGYDAETSAIFGDYADFVEQKVAVDGNVRMAFGPDGKAVYIISKDANVGEDGTLTTPSGADGLVQYMDMAGGQVKTAKASDFVGAFSQDIDTFVMDQEADFAQQRKEAIEQAENTISPLGMAEALAERKGQTVYISGSGAYEPVVVERVRGNGSSVVISGERDALAQIAQLAGITSPGSTRLEIPVEKLYPLLAKEEDGSLSTDQPEEAPAPATPASPTAPVAPATAPSASPQVQNGATMLDGRPIGNIRLDEENGWAYFTYQDDPNGMLQVMDIDEFRQKTGQATAPAQTETPAAPASAPTASGASAPVPATGESGIPVDTATGKKVYDDPSVTPEMAYDDLYKGAEQNPKRAENADRFVVRKSDEARKALADAQKKIADADASKAEIDNWDIKDNEDLDDLERRQNEAKAKVDEQVAETQANLPELQRKADFWEDLRAVAEENIKARQEAAKRQALIQQYGVDTSQFDLTPQSLEEAVADMLSRFFKNGGRLNYADVASRTGLGERDLLRQGLKGVLSRDGISIDDFVHNFLAGDPATAAFVSDEQDAANTVISALQGNNRAALADVIFRNRLDAAVKAKEYAENAPKEEPKPEPKPETPPVQGPQEGPAGPAAAPEDLPPAEPPTPPAAPPASGGQQGGSTVPAPGAAGQNGAQGSGETGGNSGNSGRKPVTSQEVSAGTQTIIDSAKKLGFTPVVIRSVEDIPDSEVRAKAVAEKDGLGSLKAWVNTDTKQVFVVDGSVSEEEASGIFQHEVVAHIGLPQLLGEEEYNSLCDAVWDAMGEEDSMLFGLYALGATAPSSAATREEKVAWARGIFAQLTNADVDRINSPAVSRKAAAEYMGALAQRTDLSDDDRNVWQRIKDAFKAAMVRLKLALGGEITEEDIVSLLRASKTGLATTAITEQERVEALLSLPESAMSQSDKDRLLEIIEMAGVTGDELSDSRRYLSGENTGLIARANFAQAKQKALEYVRSRPGDLQRDRKAENGAHVGERAPENQGQVRGVQSGGSSVLLGESGSGTTVSGGGGRSQDSGGDSSGDDGSGRNSGVSGNERGAVDGKPAAGVGSEGRGGTVGNGQKPRSGRTGGQEGSGNAGNDTGRGTETRPDVNSASSEVDSILDALNNLGADATNFALRGAPSAGKLNAADRKDGVITLEGKSPEQISLIAKLGKALAKAGVALVQSGIRAYNLWSAQMKSRFGGKLKENKVLRLTDEQVDNYISEIWETDFEMDGRVLKVREWADEIGREALRNVMRLTEAEKRKLQKKADSIVPVFNDMANIREMLPYLFPEQQEDVLKAETQFFDPSHADKEHGNGKGYLFTNATGTGKTFTGAGIIKRFVKSGKGRVLIVTPTQTKVSDWVKECAKLDIDVNALGDTKDAGTGVVCTTYANFRSNDVLMGEDFDLIVYDESHNITRDLAGNETKAIAAHYQLTNKDENYALERLTTYAPFFRELNGWKNKVEENRQKISENYDRIAADGPNVELQAEITKLEAETRTLQNKIKEAEPHIAEETEKLRPRAKEAAARTKVVFLSASAFATHSSLRYAEGYIFSFPDLEKTPAGSSRDDINQMRLVKFLLDRFPHGYRRKNAKQVNQVVSDADKLEEEEMAFASYLFDSLNTASGRSLVTEYDYARKFPHIQLDMADRINSAENAILTDRVLAPLREALKKTLYDYNYGNALLETMKTTLIIPYIKQNLAMGRKVVVFHSRLSSKDALVPPFERILEMSDSLFQGDAAELMAAKMKFRQMFADVLAWEQKLNYEMPREQLVKAFGRENVLLYSGQETKGVKQKNVDTFQDDNSGKNLIVVQTQSGSEGISLHDTTGKHQRITINLSLPRSPIVAIQGEGRTLRIGSKSNAIFWYPLLGLEFEKNIFATIFAARAGTQENLSLGPMARGLRASFMNGILEHSGVVDINEDTGGRQYDAREEKSDPTYEDAIQFYHESQTTPAEGEDEQDNMPTPEPLGYMMVRWAALQDGESVLEPSAGRGAIARFVPRRNRLKGMDTNSGLVSRLMLKLSGARRNFEIARFEDYDIHNKFDAVLMNPPTGAAGTDMAYRHFSKAFKHLVEGGRIIAVLPADTDVKKVDDAAVLSGEVILPGIVTGARGPMKVVIMDKVSRKAAREKMKEFKRVDLSDARTVEEFFARLRNVEMPARKIDESAKVEKAVNAAKKALKVEGTKGIIREDRKAYVPEVVAVKKSDLYRVHRDLPGIEELDDDSVVGFEVRFLKTKNGYSYRLSSGEGYNGMFFIASPEALRAHLKFVSNRVKDFEAYSENGSLSRNGDHTLEFYKKLYDVLLNAADVTPEDVESRWFVFGELSPEEKALRDHVYSSSDEEIDEIIREYRRKAFSSYGDEEKLATRMAQIANTAWIELKNGEVARRRKENRWKELGTLSETEARFRDALQQMPMMLMKAAQQEVENRMLEMEDKTSDEYRELERRAKIAESVYIDEVNAVNDIISKYGFELKRQGGTQGLSGYFRDYSADDYNSALFERILSLVDRLNTKVLFTDTYSDSTLGSYQSGQNQLLLNASHAKNGADMAVTIIHELIHDISTYAQYGREKGRIDQDSALGITARNANRLWQSLLLSSSKPAWEYPLSNDRELLAGITNAGFREWLKNTTVYVDNAENPTRYSVSPGTSTPVESNGLAELEKIITGFIDNASPYEHSHISVPADRSEVHRHGVDAEQETSGLRFRQETDADVVERLDSEPKVTAYRAMQFVPDPNGDWEFDLGDGRGVQKGFLYPPMSAKVNGEWRPPVRKGHWERSVEQPELADEKGRFKLDKGNKKSVPAAYNPYFHSSDTMLNDQFSEAQSRNNLVVVEVELPEREVSDGNMNPYRADKAKDAVGRHEWKAGPIQGQLSGMRSVYLSRWDRPVRIVPVSEVAENVASTIGGQISVMPSNVVWPQLRAELEKRGVAFVETDNRGMLTSGENAGASYGSVYGRKRSSAEQAAARREREAREASIRGILEAERLSTERTLDRMSQELGIQINRVPRSAMPAGHRSDKGYYNPNTGEMTICMDNVTDERDAIATVMHETVGHHGLRKLLGDKFNETMVRIHAALDAKGRRWVNSYMQRHGLQPGDSDAIIRGMEEYLAHLAESGDFKNSVWNDIKEILGRIIDAIFGTDGFVFTDRELNYILRASYENLKDPNWLNTVQGRAKDTLMKRALGINETDPHRPTDPDGPGTGLVYRDGDNSAREEYEFQVTREHNVMLRENQNADLPVKIGMEQIMREVGKTTLSDSEDYLTRHNLASSRAESECHEFELFHFEPLLEQVRAIRDRLTGGRANKGARDAAYKRVQDYMYAVSGLERNEFKNNEIEQAKQDELENAREHAKDKINKAIADGEPDSVIDEINAKLADEEKEITARYEAMKKDWSGLTALMGRPESEWREAEDDARAMVDAFRSDVANDDMLDELWDRVRSCTDFSLDHAYKYGLISKDVYERLHGTPTQPRMWNYYLPLRGFDEETAEEVYDYASFVNPSSNSVVVKKMEGRKTKAIDPIANILNIAETEIVQGNDNWAKQALYNFVLHAGENSLLSVRDPWYVKVAGTDEWEMAEPMPNETLEHFEKRMEAARAADPKGVKKGHRGLRVDRIITNPQHKNEHTIRLKIGGMERIIWVNGNPALARAVTGLGRQQNMKILRRVSRSISNLFTTYSLDFTARNLIRDSVYAFVSLHVKEDRAYRHRFYKNWIRNFGFGAFAAPMIRFAAMWDSGKLQQKADPTEREQMFMDFMRDGGQTGYTIVSTVRDIKDQLERSMRQAGSKTRKIRIPILGHFAALVKTLNEAFELLTRFTAYQTSREMGRSGQKAASDAKEISVNFNRRGAQSGEGPWGVMAAYLGASHYFYNAGVQGFDNFLRLFKVAPVGMTATTAGIAMMGMITPMINAMLAGLAEGDGGDGDDNDDWYWNLPEWVRRNNLVLGTGKFYIAAPLPVEFRAFYGLGDIAGSAFLFNKYPDRKFGNVALDMISTASGILPFNPIEGYNGGGNLGDTVLRSVVPDAGMFLVDYATNRDYTGRPLAKENPFTKTVPKVQGAYASTPKALVELCQKIGEQTGWDIPPGVLRDLFNNYGGGFYRVAEDLAKRWYTDEEHPKRWDDIPFLSGFTGHIDEDRSKSFAQGALHDYKEISDKVVRDINLRAGTKDISVAMAYGDINELPEDVRSRVAVQRILSGKDYELGKMYREGMNKQHTGKFEYVVSKKDGSLRKKEIMKPGVDALRKTWNDLKDVWAKMPDKTEEEKAAKARAYAAVTDAWHDYYNAQGDLAEKLLEFEFGERGNRYTRAAYRFGKSIRGKAKDVKDKVE